MGSQDISPDFPFTKKHTPVLDSTMAYVDTGLPNETAPTAVFIHGNPTSSYLWRNIIPHVSPVARCIAPDLVGFGDSGKMPSNGYYLREHSKYFGAFMDAVVPQSSKIFFVIQDWGSYLGFQWAFKNPSRVAGLIFMEHIYASMGPETFPGWEMFSKFRTEDVGRQLIIEQNMFVEGFLGKMGTVRGLTDAEMEHYRRPFLKPEDREPTWRMPNEIPFEGRAPDVWDEVTAYQKWMEDSQNQVPKLFLWAEPGALVPAWKVKELAGALPNVRTVCIGAGTHFVQEDNPHMIGDETKKFVEEVMSGKFSP